MLTIVSLRLDVTGPKRPTFTPKPARDYLLRQAEKHERLAEQALSGPNVHNSESARHLYLAEQYRQAANA